MQYQNSKKTKKIIFGSNTSSEEELRYAALTLEIIPVKNNDAVVQKMNNLEIVLVHVWWTLMCNLWIIIIYDLYGIWSMIQRNQSLGMQNFQSCWRNENIIVRSSSHVSTPRLHILLANDNAPTSACEIDEFAARGPRPRPTRSKFSRSWRPCDSRHRVLVRVRQICDSAKFQYILQLFFPA